MSAWHSAYALILLITGLHFENRPIVKLTLPSSDDTVQATSGNYKTELDAYNSLLLQGHLFCFTDIPCFFPTYFKISF